MLMPLHKPGSLTGRLSLCYSALFAGALLIALLICYAWASSLLTAQMSEDLQEDIVELRELQAVDGLERIKEEIGNEVAGGEESSVYFLVYDQDANLVFSSDLSSWHLPVSGADRIAALAESGEDAILDTLVLPDKEHPTRMIFAQLDDRLYLEIGESTEEKDDILELLSAIFAGLFLVVVPITALGGWYVTQRSVRDVNRVSEAAREIRDGHLDTSVHVSPQAAIELQDLAGSFNAMAGRINQLVQEMREMTDNIAHDLRSPITRIRAICETALSSAKTSDELALAIEDTLIECDRLIFLINSTLELSEIESGIRQAEKETFSLEQLVEDACDLYEPLAEQKRIHLQCECSTNNSDYLGQKYSIQRMLTNIIDNAIKYSGANSKIRVQLTDTDTAFRIAVSDQGAGIAECDSDKIFQRFYRCEAARRSDGCGLGLSFSMAVARYHGGSIRVESTKSQGSTFVVELPKTR